VVGQVLGQALVEGGMLHVDDHTADFFTGDLFGQAVGFLLRGEAGHGYVAGAIGEQDHQGIDIGVKDALFLEHLQGQEKAGRERGFTTHGDICQGTLGQLNGVGGGKDQCGAILLKYYQAHPVSALVGIGEQGENGAFGGGHALGNSHRPGGIDDEDDQIGGFFDADFALQVAGVNGKGDMTALFHTLFLEWRGGTQGGVEGNVIVATIGGAGLDVTATFTVGTGARTPPGVVPGDAIERVLDFANFKSLTDFDFFATIPPVGADLVKDVLAGRLCRGVF
jgi:hypothetical protein